MFKFEHSEYLWMLTILPVLVVFFLVAWQFRKKALERFGGFKAMQKIAPGLSKYRHLVKFSILAVGIAFLIVGMSNPQWGSKRQPVKRKGIDLFIALDISQSMMAQDVSPNRLERAKRFSQQLVNQLAGNNIGVILFACNAFSMTPLTTDYAFANLSLATANTDQAGAQGTAIGEAIDMAERSFKEENETHKAVIIITDGEDHDGSAALRAKEAHGNGTLIFTVGVGQEEGAFIPVIAGGRSDYLRDNSGNPVRTKLVPETLEEIAVAGGGEYFALSNNADALTEAIQQRVERIEKREFEERIFTDYESYFQIFVGIAFILLVIEFLLSYRDNSQLQKT